ncbi:MAG: YihY/virulence factor BrkB family protein [Opitutus sp.]
MTRLEERAPTSAPSDLLTSKTEMVHQQSVQSQRQPSEQSEADDPHGRSADSPTEVPKKGWLDILTRTKEELAQDNLSIVAAGIAFYWFLAFIPALGAVISIYALVADPAQVSEHLSLLNQVMPAEIMPMLREQLTRLTSADQAAGISAIISFVLALYGSSKAATALIQGLNIAYDEEEKRGFLKLQAIALLLTVCGVIGAVFAIGLVAVLPSILGHMHLGKGAALFASILRWPILIGGFMLALAVVYRYAPSRDEPKWRWVSWGAVLGAGLWVLGSAAFSIYAATFGNYDKTYGSLGALVIFLFWLYLTAYTVLIGAELNSEMERQTAKDTTQGPPKPMGQRQAYSADTVGHARGEKKN